MRSRTHFSHHTGASIELDGRTCDDGWPHVRGEAGPRSAALTRSGRGPSVWRWLVLVAATVGYICGYADWGWLGMLTLVLTAWVLAGLVTVALWVGDGNGFAMRAGRVALTSFLLAIAAAGLVGVFGVAGLFIVLALAAPWLRARVRRRWPRHTGGAPGAEGRRGVEGPSQDVADFTGDLAVRAEQDLGVLDVHTLCRAWRDSFSRLQDATSATQRLAVVHERERYLDELHRRSPQGLAAWFASGGRASSSPLPFLADHDSRTE